MNTKRHLLESETTRLRLERLARAMLGVPTMTVRFGPSVQTNITSWIELNPRLAIRDDLPLWTQWILLLGQLYHEVGHQFTEVDSMSRVQQPYDTPLKKQVAATILNILEDSRIELLQANDLAGCGPVLRFCNEHALQKRPSLDELKDKPQLTQFIEALLQRAVVGRYKGTVHDPDVRQKLESLEHLLHVARIAPSTSVVIECTHEVMALIEPYFSAYQQPEIPSLMKPEHTDATGSASPKDAPEVTWEVHYKPKNNRKNHEEASQDDEDAEASTAEGSGEGNETGELSDDTDIAKTDRKTEDREASREAEDAESATDDGSDDEVKADEPWDDAEPDDKIEAGELWNDADVDLDSSDEARGSSASDTTTVFEPSAPEPEEGRSRESESNTTRVSDLAEDFEDLRDEAIRQVEEMERQEKGAERKRREEDAANRHEGENAERYTANINGGHQHITLTIRDTIPVSVEVYNQDRAKIAGPSKALEHKIRQMFERQYSSIQRGQTSGRLDLRNLHKLWQPNTNTIFYRRSSPDSEFDVVAGLLIDQSGSMYRHDRWIHARQAAVMFHRVLQASRIPHFAVGFTTGILRNEVVHYHFITFQNWQSPNAGLRLSAVEALGENRDGYSIRVAVNMLRVRPERQKFLVVISDGAPDHRDASYPYYGDRAIDDTRQAVIEAERDGIAVIGVSIGETHHHVSKIYRFSVIVPHITELPLHFARVLDRVLVRNH